MNILVAIDGSEYSRWALQFVIRQIAPAGKNVQVLQVVDLFSDLPIYYAYAPAQGVEKMEVEMLARAEALVKQAAHDLFAAGFEATTRVEKGDPKSKILEVAAEWKADLIVMGSHGRAGMDRFLLGSISEAVSRYAHCSVEIVRAPKAGKMAPATGA